MDLGRVAQALYPLLDDACDVLQATQCKALAERRWFDAVCPILGFSG
ncbi:hypothetical protein C4K04_6431 [Pseudomonas chlororaphis]|uniref:Uncharacterized protein n=1 Tax=Pseudomonas chlororaphis TaxID=587753 RepID=A0A3G7U0G4_9PSED|nr:hypothetical protein C4K04_6431 [Pseudomonas chlororaphis]